MASAGGSSSASANQAPVVQNIDIRVPKATNKKLSIMRFNNSTGADFSDWSHPKMERENNQVQFKSFNEDMPKFGAGSEYGREQREEARRKKYGIISKKYKPEDQPWILNCGGKNGRKFRGVREGGVAENASYYVFTQAPDGAFEAFPVKEWYNFTAHQSYKALSYEEAEEKFGQRNNTYNYFNVMIRKRMQKEEGEEDDEGEEGGEGKKKGKAKKKDTRFGDDLEASGSSDDEENGEENDDEDETKKRKNKKGKKPAKQKKRKYGSDDEAFEDSDDGDGEGRELDYISSSDGQSDSDLEAKVKEELKGVAEEDALRKLLNSDDEDEEEQSVKDENENEEEKSDEDRPPSGQSSTKDEKGEKKKKKEKKSKDKKPRKEDYGSSSESNDESSSSELDKPKPSPKLKPGSASSSRSATPTKPLLSMPDASSDTKKKSQTEDVKRKQPPDVSLAQAAKKARMEAVSAASSASPASASSASSSNDGINEETVRRYLSRKPMTTTELLQKLKSKKTSLSSDQLVPQIAQILKKINPEKQMVKGKMYLSIKKE